MSQDDLDPIPSIVPSRDRETHFASPGASRAGKGGVSAKTVRRPPAASAGIWSSLFITVALVVAAVACAWAWQLQEALQQSSFAMEKADQRISDLEDRLADTDEGLSQNTASMAVKISESQSEIRKLWDDRKKTNPKILKLTGDAANAGRKIGAAQKSMAATQTQLSAVSADVTKLKSVAGELDRLMTSAKSNQAEVERVADDLNRINLEYAKVDKRVKGNEEWLASVNAFRGQVNSALTRMQADIRALQATP
ncbi:MAG: chromosome segregation ATPase [Halioglobus sp.]|jgi:chromosome segregation ATPase